jgi:Na+-transporting NADH:ubiquinone oxidoreductase subunit NqrB
LKNQLEIAIICVVIYMCITNHEVIESLAVDSMILHIVAPWIGSCVHGGML